MSLSRRVVIGLLAVAALAAALLVILRFRLQADPPHASQAATTSGTGGAAGNAIPKTSEAVIAAALAAGDITYEESLLQRAYAIFDDPRLDPLFRSPVMNWDSASALFLEIDAKEGTLSADLLAELLPFRVRPNDPRSIVNRPRSEIVKTQLPIPHTSAVGWIGRSVPGTNLRIWIKGSPVDLDPYEPLFSQVWVAFKDFFSYPDNDDVGPDLETNPDGAIDFYLINGTEVDPRADDCLNVNAPLYWCGVGSGAVTKPAAPRSGRKTSGYVLLNRRTLDETELIDTIAHELTHVSQFGYDAYEDAWLKDSTASWVAYKVVKQLGRHPRLEYDRAARLFKELHLPLNRTDETSDHEYESWVFFFYASTELGNGIVEEVWKEAALGGIDEVRAVDRAIPLDKHFPGFTVRNWNKPQPGPEYRSWDRDFPGLQPDPINGLPPGPGMVELDEPLPRLAAQYYYYPAFDNNVRRVTLLNFYAQVPTAHIWAIKRVGADWKPPEDWSRRATVILCRDVPADNVSELVLIVSNTDLTAPLDPALPKPQVVSEEVGCETVEGTAKATLRLNDPDAQTNMTYVASLTTVQFKPRSVQNTPFNTEYDLLPTSVVWTAAGTKNGCKVDGRMLVNIPSFIDQPLDPTRLAWGYLNVVAKPGGDFHSVHISAFDPGARIKLTCPGNPPTIRLEPFDSVYLSKILTQTNTHVGNQIYYKGTQTLDPDRFQDNLPAPALEVLKNFPQAQAMLNRQGGKLVYTFEWDMKPRPSP